MGEAMGEKQTLFVEAGVGNGKNFVSAANEQMIVVLGWLAVGCLGQELPRLLYGTAWKKNATAALLVQALELGYPGFDTANQKAHYEEALVGQGLLESNLPVYSQTKFSFKEFQYDGNLPFTENAPIATQVSESIAGSLSHLRLPRLDALLLHGPMHQGQALEEIDIEAWRAMELACKANLTVVLGITNFTPEQVMHLFQIAEIKPTVWQTKCLANDHWSNRIRVVARRVGVKLQCYSVVSGNRKLLSHPTVVEIATHKRVLPVQVLIRFIHQYFDHAQVLSGSANYTQMKQVYDAMFDDQQMELFPNELASLANIQHVNDEGKVQVTFINHHYYQSLNVYWWTNHNWRLDIQVPPQTRQAMNTFHKHEFKVTLNSNGTSDQVLLMEHWTVNASNGPLQTKHFPDPLDEL
ncbi:hypothetical protein BASA81_000992 [Batrachochytrium salamandrivorans]|nr:hypothetical protein BASA81_000992 [Batrachochytrium salamandrivorans]